MKRLPIKQILTIGILPSFLKKIVYKFKGYHIGSNVKFSFGSIILVKNSCFIGDKNEFGFFSVIQCNKLIIGKSNSIRSLTLIKANEVNIGNNVIISETAIIRAGHICSRSNIIIEDRVHIFPHVIIDPSYPVRIGEETGVGFYSNIYTHGSYKNVLDGYPITYGEVSIGKRVELTYNVFIAPGVTIENDSIVAYGSYVNSDIPEGVLAAGCPAKVKRTSEHLKKKLDSRDRLKIIQNIIKNFLEHITFIWPEIHLKTIKQNSEWILSKGRLSTTIRLINNEEDIIKNIENQSIIILVNTRINISSQNKSIEWFDLNYYMHSNINSKIGNELNEYFGRYGIRFRESN